MGKPNGNAALFALDLRRAIDRNGMSLRLLGKLTDPDDPERGRRRVQRHLSGRTTPTSASRALYAEVLGAPELLPDSDDDEDSLYEALLAGIEQKPQHARVLLRTLERLSA